MNVCYYVSGHGFGHATRAAEIINELLALDVTVHIVTLVPEVIWTASGVFRSELCTFRRPKQPLDCGPLQTSPLDIEEEQSLVAYTAMMVNRGALVAEEVEYIKLVQARLVISDISPLACAAAHEAQVPSCVCGNFSWVEIFAPFLIKPEFALYRPLLDTISADYCKATFLLRMPGFMPMPCFHDIIDVSLVVRMAHRSRAEVRESLSLSEKTKVLLFCFGGQPSDWVIKESFLPEGWTCLVFTTAVDPPESKRFLHLPPDAYLPDLYEAADVAIGKIGYGSVSESIAHDTPLLYCSRKGFSEELYLVKLLCQHGVGQELSREDFKIGNWKEPLDTLWSAVQKRRAELGERPSPPQRTPFLSGAQLAARCALQFATRYQIRVDDDATASSFIDAELLAPGLACSLSSAPLSITESEDGTL